MSNKVKQLFDKKKINQEQYDLFQIFSQTQGAKFLKNQLLRIAMEESPTVTDPGFAWIDGRRSVWRDIRNTLTHIHDLLEENNGICE